LNLKVIPRLHWIRPSYHYLSYLHFLVALLLLQRLLQRQILLHLKKKLLPKKSVQVVSSLSLSLSMVRTTTTVTTTHGGTPPSSTPASSIISSSLAPPASSTSTRSPASIPNSGSVRTDYTSKRTHSFDVAESEEDIQIFSLPRRRTKSMSMSLSNSTSLFAGFETSSVSKPKSIPKVEPLTTVLRAPVVASTPESPVADDLDDLPGKRLPFFATLAISPKPEMQTPTPETQNP